MTIQGRGQAKIHSIGTGTKQTRRIQDVRLLLTAALAKPLPTFSIHALQLHPASLSFFATEETPFHINFVDPLRQTVVVPGFSSQ